MMQALKNLIRIGAKTSTVDSQRVTVSSLGKDQKAFAVIPWGMESNPPDDTLAVILQQEANEASLLTLLTALSGRSTLEEGEVAFGSPESDTRWKARPDGTVTIIIDGADGGDFLARFNELKAGFDALKSDFNTFVTTTYNLHNHPTAPVGPVSPPSVVGTSSTASIDAAKIDEIEVPS